MNWKTVRDSASRIVAALGFAGCVIVLSLAIWFGSDIWSFLVGRMAVDEPTVPRETRIVRNAETKTVPCPEPGLTVPDLKPKQEQRLRERHGQPALAPVVISEAPKPEPAPPVAPGAPSYPAPTIAPVAPAQTYPAPIGEWHVAAEDCDNDGAGCDVAVWMREDGTFYITTAAPDEAAVRRLGRALADLVSIRHVIEAEGRYELSGGQWEIGGAWLPVHVARTDIGLAITHRSASDDGLPADTRVWITAKTRVEIKRP